MAETTEPAAPRGDFFDSLIDGSPGAERAEGFTVGFRGYERSEVDAALASLKDELRRTKAALAAADERRAAETADLEKAHAAEVAAAEKRHVAEVSRVREEGGDQAGRLEDDLAAAKAQLADAQAQITKLSTALAASPDEEDERSAKERFETVLRVAEEQAGVLIQNAAVQAERLLEAAREEAEVKRAELDADVARITAQAQHDADQVRLRMETEYAAHQAQIEREAAHAGEKVGQAEQEAATIRTEAEKGAAALRAMVTRETTDLRAEAERGVREMTARTLELEESLTRRQDDAQQEFLVLHNQAVAHAERITADANEQVAASLQHAERISAKADGYEKLMRSQAQSIEAEAQVRARETLDRARTKAQKIVDMVTAHTNGVVRDAEDRARELRWQQQQLTSFMAEVRELIRPDGVLGSEASGDGGEPVDDDAPTAEVDAAPAKAGAGKSDAEKAPATAEPEAKDAADKPAPKSDKVEPKAQAKPQTTVPQPKKAASAKS